MADVVVTYKLVPTEDSIKSSVNKIVDGLNKGFGGKSGSKAVSGLSIDVDNLNKQSKRASDSLKNVKVSLWDMVMDSYRLLNKGTYITQRGESAKRLAKDLKLIGMQKSNGTIGVKTGSTVGTSVAGQESAAGAGATGGSSAAASGVGLGAITGILGVIAGLLAIVAVASMIVAGFFEAVGPFIKIVVKLFSMFFLIALLPAFKVLMKSLPLIWSVLKIIADGIAFVLQAIIDGLGALVGVASEGMGVGTGKIDWVKLLMFIFAPIPILLAPLFVGLINSIGEMLLGKDTWGTFVTGIITFFSGIAKSVGDGVKAAGDMVNKTINDIGTDLDKSGKIVGNSIYTIITSLKDGTFWAKIASMINYIGESIFGEKVWKMIVDNITNVIKGILTAFNSAINVANLIGSGLNEVYNQIQKAIEKWSFGLIKANTKTYAATSLVNVDKAITDLTKALTNTTMSIADTGRNSGYDNTLLAKTINATNNAVSKLTGKKVGDAVITPKGIVNTDPSDYLIATKNPSTLGGNKGNTLNVYNTYNIDSKVDKNEFRDLLRQASREQAKELRNRTSYMAGTFA